MSISSSQYKSLTYKFLVVVAIIKLVAANFIELGNDEAYYYSYAIAPALNYFDHPLMVAWLIKISTLNLTGVTDVCMRLGPVVTSTIASIFIFKTASLIRNEKVGWYAVLLYQSSIYGGFIAGWFILPDAPQAPFWCAALFLMAKLILGQQQLTKTWIWLGICIGLATLSKVHGLYLWGGFGLFILWHKRQWLVDIKVYLSFFITTLFTLPIIIWNINNDFISYKFHSKRVVAKIFNGDDLIKEIVGEIIYQNPLVYSVIIVALVYFVRKKIVQNNVVVQWLLCMSLPMIGLFWYFASYNPIFPHWSGPAFVALIIVAALYLETKVVLIYPTIIKLSLALVSIVIVGAVAIVQFVPRNFGSQELSNYGEYCPTLDISGWQNFSKEFQQLQQEDIQKNVMQASSSILINSWFPAAQLEYYTARLTGLTIIATGEVQDVHQFAWLNQQRKFELGNDAYVIVPSNNPKNVEQLYGKYFKQILPPTTIEQKRSNKTVRYFYVWRLKNCTNTSFITSLN